MSDQAWNRLLREQDCIKLVLEFLANRNLHISQIALERETGTFDNFFCGFTFEIVCESNSFGSSSCLRQIYFAFHRNFN
jgi:hypothetical protein